MFSTMIRMLTIRGVVLGLVLALPISAATADGDSPEAVVKTFQQTLVDVLKQAKFLSVEERYEMLEPEVSRAFHLRMMARIAAGNHWQDANGDSRDSYVDAFSRYNVANMATMLYAYSGQKFVQRGVRDGPQETRIVDTRLEEPDGSRVKISYIMARIDGGPWQAVDVILDGGISEMKVRQSEYGRTLREGGLPGLADQLSEKAKQLLAE